MTNRTRLVSGRVPVSNSANVTSDRYQYLDLSSAEPNLGTANTGDILSYNPANPGQRQWISQNAIVGTIGISAYAQANSASANTLYIYGVDAWQNTQLIAINTFAASAYNQANTASANTIYTQGVDLTQNTNITAVNTYASSGYGVANIASANTVYTQGVDAYQNTQISNVNANTIYTQGVDAAQNTNITSALGLAASAFLTANAALPQSGGTITNSLSIGKDLTVSGNLTVLGNATSLAVTQLDIYDSLIYLANNNFTSDAVDIGIIGHYNAGVNAHSGIFRDPVRKEWIFFQGYTPEVQANNLINIADPSFAYANVYANYFKGNLIATGGITFGDSTVQTTAGSSVANTIYLQSALNSANANIGVLYGIETSQNTNIGLAWNLANTALQNTSIITLSSDLVIPGNLTVGGSSILNAISAANARGYTQGVFQASLNFAVLGAGLWAGALWVRHGIAWPLVISSIGSLIGAIFIAKNFRNRV